MSGVLAPIPGQANESASAAAESAADGEPAQAPEQRDDIHGLLHLYTVNEGETMIRIARENDLGILELMAANPGIDPWIPPVGTKLVLPKAVILPGVAREGIVVNLAELRLYYFDEASDVLFTTPIGVGRGGFATPLGETKIVRKAVGPTWRPTAETRKDAPDLPTEVPPGPDNPLGTHALYLGWPTYLIHGTNKPDGVGRRVSRGCIRLYPEQIVRFYDMIDVGTPVTVVHEPVKFGWRDGELFVEVHPDFDQLDELESKGTYPERRADGYGAVALATAGAAAGRIDWTKLKAAETERTGVPVQITRSDSPVSLFPSTHMPIVSSQ